MNPSRISTMVSKIIDRWHFKLASFIEPGNLENLVNVFPALPAPPAPVGAQRLT
jgi:hypothetical protein